MSLFGSVLMANGEAQGHPQPIHIKFKQHEPVDSVKIGEDYLLHIEWKNRDNKLSYEGYFVFLVSLENDEIGSSDLECIYDGQIIEAKVTSSGLEYHFPVCMFLSHESGFDEFSIIYQKPGKYSLDIAIAQG
jgi:hypothetical protein